VQGPCDDPSADGTSASSSCIIKSTSSGILYVKASLSQSAARSCFVASANSRKYVMWFRSSSVGLVHPSSGHAVRCPRKIRFTQTIDADKITNALPITHTHEMNGHTHTHTCLRGAVLLRPQLAELPPSCSPSSPSTTTFFCVSGAFAVFVCLRLLEVYSRVVSCFVQGQGGAKDTHTHTHTHTHTRRG
jgi:hypothetical protein